MTGFDDLLRRAKEVMGEETVNEIVREVEIRSKSDTQRIVNVERADLSPIVSKIAQVASEKPEAVGELFREVVQNLEIPETPKIEKKSGNRNKKMAVVEPKVISTDSAVDASPQPNLVDQVEESKKQIVNSPSLSPFVTSGAAMVIAESIKGEYRYAILGLVLGLASIIGGVILGLNGVAGSTSWTANLLALRSQVNDAAPGVVLFIIGLFMIVATRPRVNLKDIKG